MVLTAAHVVTVHGRPIPRVQVRTETGMVEAKVAWHRYVGDVDVALLVVIAPGWSVPSWRHPVRWGRLVTTRVGQDCRATGFPKVVATPGQRDSHEAVGLLNPGSMVKSNLYAVEVTNPPARSEPGESAWAGMSGAALRCPDLLEREVLVGVVTVDPAGFDSRRLIVVPITTVATDPSFAALVAEHTGVAPIVEPVELAGLGTEVKAPASPAGLLRADVADTPFRPRPELAQLVAWCREPAWSGLRLVTGPGGQGKTRLARQLATTMAAEGWSTLMLAETTTPDAIRVLGQVREPTLVVVDYAEGRTHQLTALVAAMGRAEAKVRLLLLARTAGAWRTDRIDANPQLEVLNQDDIVVELSSLEATPDGRRKAWEQATAAIAPRLGKLDGYSHIDWTALRTGLEAPPLEGTRFRTILAVQTDALAALLQAGDPVAPNAGGGAGEVLLAHESRYWSRVAKRHEVALGPITRHSLVAAATLWGAATADEARRVIAALLPRTDPDLLSNIVEWLATLYSDSQQYWSGLQPDSLAEHLIGTALDRQGRCPTLVGDTLAAASGAQLEHSLTLLGRAHPLHPHLAGTIAEIVLGGGGAAALTVAPRLVEPGPLLDALRRLVATADPPTLINLAIALPRSSLLLADISVSIATALVTTLREAATADRDKYLPDLAMLVNNLAVALAKTGRRAEGLIAAQEAVDLRRELVAFNRDAYLPDLAMSVNNLAVDLAEAGRRPEGLAAAQEAVDLYRELVALNRDAYLPDLAMSVNNLAVALAETGRRAEGLAAAQQAVDLRRELVALNRDAYLPDLAMSVNNLAVALAETGRRAEGLAAAQEAVDLRRELVAFNRDAYLPDLAMSVYNLAVRLGEAGRRAEGLAAAQEAVDLRRELVAFNRDAYLPDLAMSVYNLAIQFGEAGRHAEGLPAAQEAVDLRRELVALNRDAYLPDLAMSVNNLAVDLAETGRRAEGLAAAQEAVDLRRELVAFNREAYLPDLAMSVYNLAIQFGEAGRHAEGLPAAQEAVDLYRELVACNRDAYLPDLAMSVNNLAVDLAETGRRAEGLAAAQEAVDLRRELVAFNRDAYLPDLAMSVNNLAVRLGEAGRRAEGLTAAQEAVNLYKELARTEPEVFRAAGEHAIRLASALETEEL